MVIDSRENNANNTPPHRLPQRRRKPVQRPLRLQPRQPSPSLPDPDPKGSTALIASFCCIIILRNTSCLYIEQNRLYSCSTKHDTNPTILRTSRVFMQIARRMMIQPLSRLRSLFIPRFSQSRFYLFSLLFIIFFPRPLHPIIPVLPPPPPRPLPLSFLPLQPPPPSQHHPAAKPTPPSPPT